MFMKALLLIPGIVVSIATLASSSALAQVQAVTIGAIPSLGGSIVGPTALNNAGQVVGYSTLPGDAQTHGFVCASGVTYDLGTLGGSYSQANALNSRGQIVGDSVLGNEFDGHGFLVDAGVMYDITTLGGSQNSAVAINDAGDVVGSSLITGDRQRHAFLLHNGSLLDLGTLGGTYSTAVSVNKLGQVAGNSYLTGNARIHAFVWSGGTMRDVGTLGGSYSYAGALSDNGDLIGDSQTAGSENHAYLFRANTLIDLGTLGGWYSSATDVNKNGWVVGVALKDTAEMHGFVFANGQMTDLGTLGGSYSSASAINSQGEIVGESEDENFVIVPFLWSNGSMVNLNTLLPPDSGWELSTASFINDAGHIVGSGILNGVSTYYLLTRPVAAANSAPVANAGADVTVDCSTGAVLDGHLSADPDGDALSYEWREGSTVLGSGVTLTVSLPLGTHVVTLKVTDTHGATSEDAANVVVKDLTAPVITSVSATPNRIDKKNGKMVPVTLTVAATDNCDRAPVSKIVSITSDDSTTGKPGSKAGQTDWEITGALTANLRAETANGKSSRVYTLTVQCSDSSGNKSLKTVTVAVRE